MATLTTDRNYQIEFPHYDDILPDLPQGWEDNSWHNDACPSMDYDLGEERILRVWMDFKSVNKREYKKGKRFVVSVGEYTELQPLFTSDSYQEVLDYINTNNLTKEG
jgi:hypothetical protein